PHGPVITFSIRALRREACWHFFPSFPSSPPIPYVPCELAPTSLGQCDSHLSCFFVPSPVFLLRCSLIPGRWGILVRQGLHMRSMYWDPLLAPSWLGSGCCPGGVSVGPRSY